MNYRGSYRRLLRNSQSAILAAIEVYNKPSMEYRDECFVILLLNAWELLLKAILSKNRQSIFYPKRRNQPYRTVSLSDALTRAEKYFPDAIPLLPVRRNLELLSTYRDNAVHFYNADGFGQVIYALAQTSILNFKDLVKYIFGEDIAEKITWQLLPLGIAPPTDPITYIGAKSSSDIGARSVAERKTRSSAVVQFIAELAAATTEVEDSGTDTGRLLTVFKVNLQSIKKIAKADVTIGVRGEGDGAGPLAIVKAVDPNISHPLRQKDIVAKVGTLHGRRFTPFVFQALCANFGWKQNPHFCWQASEGVLTRYSNDLAQEIQRVSAKDLEDALTSYRQRRKKKKTRSK